MYEHPPLALGVALAGSEHAADVFFETTPLSMSADAAKFCDLSRPHVTETCTLSSTDAGHALGLRDSGTHRLLGLVEIGDDPAFDAAGFLMPHANDAYRRTRRGIRQLRTRLDRGDQAHDLARPDVEDAGDVLRRTASPALLAHRYTSPMRCHERGSSFGALRGGVSGLRKAMRPGARKSNVA